MRSLLSRFAAPVVVVFAFGLFAARSEATEITAFVSGAEPSELWQRGVGASLTITIFNIAGVEAELARQNGEALNTSLTSISGRILVAPPFGRLVPYAGLSTGAYRESVPGDSDYGTMNGFFVGVKVKLALAVHARGEYAWLDLPAAAPVALDRRFSLGVGLSF
jgi:hypothetical protein